MVEVRPKRCLGRTETDREISKRAVVVEEEDKRTMKTTLRSERKSLLKKCLTGPTLLEMSDYPVNQDLTGFSVRSTPHVLVGHTEVVELRPTIL